MDLKSKVLAAVGREPTPIYKVAQQAGLCVTTTSKYLYILQAENKVVMTSFGNMKLVKKK